MKQKDQQLEAERDETKLKLEKKLKDKNPEKMLNVHFKTDKSPRCKTWMFNISTKNRKVTKIDRK